MNSSSDIIGVPLREASTQLVDTLRRPLRNLRLSLIDKCNLRCQYCMPEEEYVWLPRQDFLSVDEIGRLIDLFAGLGVDRVRLTGGEPLLRKEAAEVVARIKEDARIRDLSMTTNGVLLAEHAEALLAAGLDRVTVSLDTLRRDRFRDLAQRDQLDRVMAGIEAAATAGLKKIKINTVVMRGYNDDEIVDLIEFANANEAEVRFIEYMDVGGATRWSMDAVVSRREIIDILEGHFGPVRRLDENGWAPADRYALPNGTILGIISSTTEPFCRTCDRSRLTADGVWFLCLYAEAGIDLRTPMRNGASDDELRSLIVNGWSQRADRGAEQRAALSSRGPLYQIEDLRRDPHREMHTRGG